jgi:hypothetical protein
MAGRGITDTEAAGVHELRMLFRAEAIHIFLEPKLRCMPATDYAKQV